MRHKPGYHPRKKIINDIWDENLILTHAASKDRELTQYKIGNFNIDKDISKMFKTKKKNSRVSDTLI
mgnify:CR=1 FL=1